MLKLLVAVDRSLEASIALRMACFFGLQIHIQPIHVVDPPDRNIAFGAGWAWKSWERETSQQAEESIEDLVITERSHCPNIEDPVVLTGDPFLKITQYFWDNGFDLLVVGAPFKGLETRALKQRFSSIGRKSDSGLPLLVVRHLKNIDRIVALTDGGEAAEKALGILIRLVPLLTAEIDLIALAQRNNSSPATEALNLERGLAIFQEKGIEVTGKTISALDFEQLKNALQEADLLVSPYPMEDARMLNQDMKVDDKKAALFCIGAE